MNLHKGMRDANIKVKNEDGEYENLDINDWSLSIDNLDNKEIDDDLSGTGNFEIRNAPLDGFFDADINIDISVLYFSEDYLIYEINAGGHISLNALEKNEGNNPREIDLENLPDRVKQSVGKELL